MDRSAWGDTTLDATTLFAANMIILWVMALALAVAGRGRKQEAYWKSWVVANLVLGLALAIYTFDWKLSPFLAAILPNGLLILGVSLRWRAAREFSSRPAPSWLVWSPLLGFLAVVAPSAAIDYALAFTLSNILLAGLSFAAAWEFWRDRKDGLPSRYALVVAYAVMGASFAWRICIGLFDAAAMPHHLPQDMALVIHLTIAVFYTAASSAFALSLAYERSTAALRHTASHDALTGLLNRGAFETALHGALMQIPCRSFALALFDIDHFKLINDRYGHAAGDEALRICAQICLDEVGEAGIVARIGGEEFAVILYDVDHQQAREEAEQIRHAVATRQIRVQSGDFCITLSGGVCHSDAAPYDFDTLIRLADTALYEAKNNGRNHIITVDLDGLPEAMDCEQISQSEVLAPAPRRSAQAAA